jgi:sec-independent protein translocase protein TatA
MPELIIILVILLVLFGGSKLPGLAKGLGQSIKEFKKSTKDDPEPEPEPAKTSEVKKPEPTVRHGTN